MISISTTRRLWVALAVGAVLNWPGCAGQTGHEVSGDAPGPVAARIRASLGEMTSPAGPHSAQPFLAVAADGRVLASWLEQTAPGSATRRFRFASFDGTRWSTPATIVEHDRFFANWADVPSIVAMSDGTLAAHWLELTGSSTSAYDVKVSMSRDGGHTWSTPVSPHHDGTATEHGFASLFEQSGARLGLVWLDGRDSAPHVLGGTGHGAGEMSLRATVFDGAAPRPDALVDARTCDCCPTAAVPVEGGLLVAYRDRSPDEVRDIVVTRFDGVRWSPPAHVFTDNWKLPGCPVNGPALASDGRRRVAVAWFAAPGGRARVSIAFSRDSGKTFSAPARVNEGVPIGRVAVGLLADGTALVGWIEQRDGGAEFRVRQIGPAGTRGDTVPVARLSAARAGGYPRLVRTGRTLVFAWTDASAAPRVRTAVARIDGS